MQPPSLYEWAGGMPAIERLMDVFYRKVRGDDLLAPVFAQMSAEHPQHVAHFVAEVLGGPARYSKERGGHPHMISRHLNRHLMQPQRLQWVRLLLEAADETELPDDPEFRSALVAYLEWGSRLAVLNSQPGATADPKALMPQWGWGVPGGPYTGSP
jgi:hemoglobin